MYSEITTSIRQAMSSEQFESAYLLWDEYAGSVRTSIEDGTASPAIMAEMRELVGWARTVILSFRAHGAERLKQTHVSRIYGQGNE